jgi:20S proteasome alpha/beta subunit
LLTIDDYWLSFIIAVVLPAVVALVTKRFSTGLVKSVTLLLLSAIGGALTSIQATGGTFEWRAAATGFAVTFITSVCVHFGLLKPSGITGDDGKIAQKVPAGIG